MSGFGRLRPIALGLSVACLLGATAAMAGIPCQSASETDPPSASNIDPPRIG